MVPLFRQGCRIPFKRVLCSSNKMESPPLTFEKQTSRLGMTLPLKFQSTRQIRANFRSRQINSRIDGSWRLAWLRLNSALERRMSHQGHSILRQLTHRHRKVEKLQMDEKLARKWRQQASKLALRKARILFLRQKTSLWCNKAKIQRRNKRKTACSRLSWKAITFPLESKSRAVW